MRNIYFYLLLGFLFSPIALADDVVLGNPSTGLCSANNFFCKTKFYGYFDGSYNYLLRKNSFISSIYDRNFDIEPNGFTLQQAAFTLANQPDQGFGAVLNLVAGRDAYAIAPYGWNPYFGSQTLGMTPMQAFAQYATGSFTFIAGLFESLAGLESNDPTQNTNFSRSFVTFYCEPGIHMGARTIYAATDKLNIYLGLNNGWDNIRDTVRAKTLELGTAYVDPRFSFTIVGYSGGQRAFLTQTATGPQSRRTLINAYSTYKVTPKLSFNLDGDFTVQGKSALPTSFGRATWGGLSAYINYQWFEQWATSFRGEFFNDPNGYPTGVEQNLQSLTATLSFVPRKSIIFRAETRHDFSTVNSYPNKTGVTLSNNQQSYALEGLYIF